MNCKKCNEEVAEKSSFCSNCGEPVNESSKVVQEKSEMNFAEIGKKLDNVAKKGAETFKEKTKNISDTDILIYSKLAFLISAIVAIVSPFFPYAKLGYVSINFIRIPAMYGSSGKFLDGIFLIIIAVVGIVLWKKNHKLGMLISGILAFSFMFYESRQISQFTDFGAQKGIGYYLCFLSALVMCASSVIHYKYFKKREKL